MRLISSWSAHSYQKFEIPGHGCRKDFFQWGAIRGCFKNFSRERPKVVKFDFSHSKLRKQPYFAEIFKIQGWPRLPLPTPMYQDIKMSSCHFFL